MARRSCSLRCAGYVSRDSIPSWRTGRSQFARNRMRRPGIEPGPRAWEARVLPLDHRRTALTSFACAPRIANPQDLLTTGALRHCAPRVPRLGVPMELLIIGTLHPLARRNSTDEVRLHIGALLTQAYLPVALERSALEPAHVPATTKTRPRVAIAADYQHVLRVHRGSESCRKTRCVRVGVVAILQPVRLRRAVQFSHPDLPLGRVIDSASSRAVPSKSTVRALFPRRGQPIRSRPA